MSETKLNVVELHKSYGEHEVLKGVSLQARAGDVISIIGSSGSGKSTFLRCINFLEKPSEGSISVNNEMIHLVRDKDGQLKVADKNQLRRLRTSLTMVFQHFNLWSHLTVLENVMEAPVRVLGLSKESARERAMKYLSKVGIEERAQSKYPGQSFRGTTAASVHCPGSGDGAGSVVVRRTHFGTGPGTGGGSAENHEAAGRRRKNHGGCHPRNGVCTSRIQSGDLPASGKNRRTRASVRGIWQPAKPAPSSVFIRCAEIMK